MAQTGDWVTPRLWGSVWFEKPPLLYWLTATATAFGAGPEISARLPVALLSLAFLCAFFPLVAAEFGSIAATVATATLATSAGWIVESDLCLTDLPLACFFALSVLLLLPLLRPAATRSRPRFALSGVCLGLAVLAKGLVPLVLILPAFWFLRRYWRDWWLAAVACLATAVPWYWLVYERNGYAFIEEFFFKHHFQRFYSKALEHVQPWYFYIPVLLAILFPWTPLFAWLFQKKMWDRRRQFLLLIAAFGFVFFSASLNKLPGYLLPMLPLLFVLLGSTFEGRVSIAVRKVWLIPSAVLVALVPLIAQALPPILSAGRISALGTMHLSPTYGFYIAAPLAVLMLARRSWAPMLLVLCVICAGFFVKIVTYPILDETVSARILWNRQVKPVADNLCEFWARRNWVYGLSFYRGKLIPPCYLHDAEWHLVTKSSNPPELVKK